MTADASAPFDPKDPFDAAGEIVKQKVCDALISCYRDPHLRALDPGDQFQAITVGTLTALCGTLFLLAREGARDDVMEAITTLLPFARDQAESIIKERCHDR